MTNRYETVLASAARTTAQAVTLRLKRGDSAKALVFTIDTTVDAASGSITPSIEAFSPLSGTWRTVLTGAAISGVGTISLRIGIGITAVTNVAVNDVVQETFRFSMAVADTDSMTYSVQLEVING